jgi:hypothetical protein
MAKAKPTKRQNLWDDAFKARKKLVTQYAKHQRATQAAQSKHLTQAMRVIHRHGFSVTRRVEELGFRVVPTRYAGTEYQARMESLYAFRMHRLTQAYTWVLVPPPCVLHDVLEFAVPNDAALVPALRAVVEALIDWLHPDMRVPSEFVPPAEPPQAAEEK